MFGSDVVRVVARVESHTVAPPLALLFVDASSLKPATRPAAYGDRVLIWHRDTQSYLRHSKGKDPFLYWEKADHTLLNTHEELSERSFIIQGKPKGTPLCLKDSILLESTRSARTYVYTEIEGNLKLVTVSVEPLTNFVVFAEADGSTVSPAPRHASRSRTPPPPQSPLLPRPTAPATAPRSRTPPPPVARSSVAAVVLPKAKAERKPTPAKARTRSNPVPPSPEVLRHASHAAERVTTQAPTTTVDVDDITQFGHKKKTKGSK
eukprot:TRINITY_DN2652_c0_g1_i4.p1 TRINITY_DN2652_c0_g1~~TRINITY_DN2652_c0_g1_i4.p1  ORF type:complete len:264 (-),score=57.41 TRINITY_DN2652_c0_g1_i4:76-867(-)